MMCFVFSIFHHGSQTKEALKRPIYTIYFNFGLLCLEYDTLYRKSSHKAIFVSREIRVKVNFTLIESTPESVVKIHFTLIFQFLQ